MRVAECLHIGILYKYSPDHNQLDKFACAWSTSNARVSVMHSQGLTACIWHAVASYPVRPCGNKFLMGQFYMILLDI